MRNWKRWVNAPNVLSYFLGFVVLWFGVGEIMSPQNWIAFVPDFLGNGQLATIAVLLHGLVLSACGLLLIFNYYRRLAAAVIGLLLVEIIINLYAQAGLSDVAVRDIGLLGMAIALAITEKTAAPQTISEVR